MNLLNDSTDNQEEVPLSRQRMQSNKNNTLRQATIQAMSNLLSANVDSGLMHSIGQYCLYVFSIFQQLLKTCIIPAFLFPCLRFGLQQRPANKSSIHGSFD